MSRFMACLVFSASFLMISACAGEDRSSGDAGADVGTDAGSISLNDGGVTLRHYTYKAISGVSMGAMASSYIGSRHPERFDVIGSLGGYIGNTYLLHLVNNHKMRGFCPMQQILDNISDADDPKKNPDIWCGPVPADINYHGYYYEHVEDFNNWFFSDSGGAFDRDEDLSIFQDLSMGLGNPASYNPDSPLLPAGITIKAYQDWMKDPQRCQPGHQLVIDTPPYNCNREYNPECKYPLVIFCDGEEPVGCKDGDPKLCGKDNPDYYTLNGAYDPYYTPHNKPIIVFTAVDYNENGKRDYAEPIVLNGSERYEDVGKDGCADKAEDGKGGCCGDADFTAGKCLRPYDKDSNKDPNGDDFEWEKNGNGTEGNWLYEEGEPYDDTGLDGVVTDTGKGIPADHGEGNGKFDYSPNHQRFFDHDIGLNFRKLAAKDPEALKRLDVYIDGGIRDIFNSAVNSLTIVGRLRALGMEFKVYDDFFGNPTALVPDINTDEDFFNLSVEKDFSAKGIGKNVLVMYGNPEATNDMIAEGDGAHVGTTQQAVQRFIAYFAFLGKRWPGLNFKRYYGENLGTVEHKWFFSKSLGKERRFSIALPPGYSDKEYENITYPVVYFMHGYGMDAMGMAAVALIFHSFMSEGSLPKMILVFPDGRCCLVNRDKGLRECACADDGTGDGYLCADDNGVEKSISEKDLPERECNGGSFYVDMAVDKWGDPKSAEVMKYESSMLELDDYIAKTYRVKAPADVPVGE